ncbi:ROK family protein [Carboxylicivirga taeanensis]|uniref:ROK family protein n=1 Tax=Carboxylicivirga taeanensis TaxID=1416875 RepID=UPI003F6E26F2
MKTKRYAIGVDVGGSHISSRVFDLRLNKLVEDSGRHLAINNEGSKQELLDTFEALIQPTIQKYKNEELAGVGIAMPGPFDYDKGIGLFSGENAKYVQLKNVDVRGELSQRLGMAPTDIRFINDATAFAIGEYFSGELKEAHNAIAITLGTGFGAAFLSNGIPVLVDERVPKGGCLWYLPFEEGIADDYFSTRGLIARFERLSQRKVAGVKEIADLFEEEPAAQEVFADFGKQLAVFMGPWLKRFEADKLLIGGNISNAFGLFKTPLVSHLHSMGVRTLVLESHLLENAAFVGAAALLNDDFFTSIKDQLQHM